MQNLVEKQEVNKGALQAAIEEADKKVKEDYTEESFESFERVLKSAKEVYADENAAQEEVDNQTALLNAAMANLVAKPTEPENPADKSKLESSLEKAEALTRADYTEETWKIFAEALEKAQSVAGNETATQEEVDEAVSGLESAMTQLEKVDGGEEKPSVEELKALVEKAEELNKDDYVASTWDNFAQALEAAKAVLDLDDATQAEIEAAEENLQKAMEALLSKTGWQVINGQKYYYGEDGTKKTGWQEIDGKKYYFGEENDGAMKTYWQQIDGKWYFFGNDGVMRTYWQKIWGKWYFLGACEPEPVLILGWFNGPAYRGMLMHTKVFGKYNGPEDVMERTDGYTEINVIDNYAPSAKAVITVMDANGKPVKDALVEFKIYNYAEFNSVARKKTDADGKCSLSAGKGDMLVWASKDGKFGYSKVSFGKDGEVTIALNKKPGDVETIALDIVPPVDGSIPAEVTPEQKEANAKRLLEEDAIRNKYVATFYTEEKAEALAKELGIDPMKTEDFMIGSRGNWMEIEKFLRETPAEKRVQAMALLDVVSAKDLRDTPASVFADHLNNTPAVQSEWFNEYIMNPRVANEFLTPYKSFFAANIEPSLAKQAVENPQALVDWVKNNVSINDALNAQRIPIMPMGVWKSRIADKGSRNIFFVAVARSLGIPARIEPVARKIQYFKDNAWVDVDFEAAVQTTAKQGKVIASYQPIKALQDPKYYSHFTIAKVLPNGTLQTLNFERGGNVDMGLGDTWSGLLKKPLSMDEGNYMLVTGTRMANGSVLAEIEFFNVEADKTTPIQLEMRESKDEIQVIGNFNSENKFKRADNGEETSLLATTGRGYYIVALLGSRQEPTNHAMRDIAAVKKELEDWGRGIVLLFPDEKGYKNFDPKEFGDLPGTITYGLDIDGAIQKEMATAMKLQNANTLPIFLIADTFNRVVFVSQGYTIGLGEQLMKVIHKL